MGKYAWFEYPLALTSYLSNRLSRNPFSVTLELTRRCNARCDYCNHWKEQRQSEMELKDFLGAIQRYRPFYVVICGGEPFMRRDAIDIIRAVKSAPGPFRYVQIITNAWFLDEKRIEALHHSRIDQITVSLNWPDERQDEDRKLPGLFRRITTAVPAMVARGMKVVFNVVMMNDNLDELVAIAHLARSMGALANYSLYSLLPADNASHLFPPDRVARLEEVLAELLRFKEAHGHIANTRWYFQHIPVYLRGGTLPPCPGGKYMVHISPGGQVKACADLPALGHYTEYDPRAAPEQTCTGCFTGCRGENQAPVNLARIIEAVRTG